MALRKALAALGEKPPYVLVGQSMGGRFTRLFAREYPGEVAGMVLVDAEHEDGLFMGVNGKPVAISTLTDAEFDAAFRPPAGPPPPLPEAALRPSPHTSAFRRICSRHVFCSSAASSSR